ncbi:AHH domain-containing protein [Marinibactrum halimedae]|uniref:Uncharacterized protein n=1 Tax=Marinibactrum halimedae TaxID=1444977 RepID=A0AA37WLF0_9GAMM|nr:AHH domain-containing protein [Marinibactrum halimedae]MCD9457416.1 AHH domain-containing protein [Marinibactrum halimedae]GLS25533.1 hypothetical protein GCM10007877_12470 [Marinibactrum halimedae]
MAIPSSTLKIYEMTRIDRAIEAFVQIENPKASDLNLIKVQSDIENGLEQYRIGALSMTERERLDEKHCSSKLAAFMTAEGDTRPHPECHCHAIVSGAHSEAAVLRAVLAWLAVRIDDPRNGCWLPRNTAARSKMPEWLKNAIPHSRIHRKTYYRWLEDNINFTMTPTLNDLVLKLKIIRTCLQQGNVRPDILLDLGYEVSN